MPARSVFIKINNLTEFGLTKIKEQLDGGEWSNGKHPPDKIAPKTQIYFESESNGIMTGTEGYVKYRIEDGTNSEFYFHWNNPYASNVIGNHYNTFHESINDKYAIWHTGNDNDQNEILDLFIDISKDVVVPNFLPSTCGFKFDNSWSDFGYPIPSLHDIPIIGDVKFGDASNGLCGGMVYAVRDYYEAKVQIPQTRMVPNNADDPLTKYIIDRLLASLDVNDITMYIKLMNPAYADTDDGALHQLGQQGRAYVTIKEEWPMIKNDIDRGHPCPIGLIRIKSTLPWDVGHNHQVMVYGYKMSGSNVLLRVYDPNASQNDGLAINLSLGSAGEPVKAIYNRNDGQPIYAIFRTNYEARDFFPRILSPATKNECNYSCSREPNHMDIFWIGADGKIYSSWWHMGDTWDNHMFQIPGNYPAPATGTKVTSCSREPNHMDLFWAGSDGKIYSSWWHMGDVWDNHVFQIPGNYPAPAAGTGVSVCSRMPNHIDIFWVGNDGKIYSSWWHTGDVWDNHVFQIPGNYPAPAAGTGISSCAREPNHIDIFWVGNDGKIYSSWWHTGDVWDNHVFQIPGSYPAPAAGTGVSSCSREPNHIDIFWVGSDGKIYSSWWHMNDTWNNHVFQIPGNYPIPSAGAGVSSCSREPNHIDIFWVGSDGKIYSSWWHAGDVWDNHVFQIPGNYPAPISEPGITSCAREPDHIDLFWACSDGKIYSSWWHMGGAWDNHLFKIPGNYLV
jgi:hypothetical protein